MHTDQWSVKSSGIVSLREHLSASLSNAESNVFPSSSSDDSESDDAPDRICDTHGGHGDKGQSSGHNGEIAHDYDESDKDKASSNEGHEDKISSSNAAPKSNSDSNSNQTPKIR
ncbi:hypothetical protein F443_06220 [Phytophthora nicotianae P1569]|uniref:Uncharacterized protein n=1 Tax=Phytophthora nicotianae P1569 TaxID=1317065 RepID=V9FIE7_PHYNI|nr:hypothetical protein F443_06220 [Phytophthora nicotianae P1569]